MEITLTVSPLFDIAAMIAAVAMLIYALRNP
jgi:hypothetical protein